jgi:hypothetical protein
LIILMTLSLWINLHAGKITLNFSSHFSLESSIYV